MRTLLVPLVLLAWVTAASAAVPLPTSPTWVASETELNGTGLDIGDIDGDGWLDLAVSNGNDITASPNLVYHGRGDGDLPPTASWVSDDARYSGHCQLGDVDGDGHLELMVTNYIAEGWGPAQVQLYDNDGGVLATSPTWESPATFHSFRAAFGDPDGDGDLDLAVATGEAYLGQDEPNLIFFNEGGTLAATPGWTSQGADSSYDVTFADVDGDGDQDLAFCGGGSGGRIKIHFNEGGVIDPVPGWTTAADDNGNTFDLDDLDGDGRLDLLVGFNSQLGGSGRFAVFLTGGGALPTMPTWTSDFAGYGSAVVCADLDGTGGPDLVTGGWWEPVRVYLNDGTGGFPAAPQWQTDTAWESVVENIALADLDGAATVERTLVFEDVTGLLELDDRHLQAVVAVTADGVPLAAGAYCHSVRDGWISLAGPADVVEVTYLASPALDVAISNWDDGTYVFARDPATAVDEVELASTELVTGLRAFPSPFNPRTTIGWRLSRPVDRAVLRMVDLRGREVGRRDLGALAAGMHRWTWRPDDLPSGVYLYRLDAGGMVATGKVVLAR
ncbi:hypothetical protein GF314_12100 [bacterium]|nr:hypothetical protein [bacterium]